MTKRKLDLVRNIGQAVLLLALAGCAAPSRATVVPAKPVAPSAAPAAATDTASPVQVAPAKPAATGAAAGDLATDRLYVTGTDGYSVSRLFVLDGASGKAERTLPSGYITPDWSTLYQVAPVLNSTTIRAYDVATGRLLRETTLVGLYNPPTPAEEPWQSSFSPDGRYLALFQEPSRAEQQQWEKTGKPRTRILVLDTSFRGEPRRIDLEGNFWFDALSAGGVSLYLIEVLDAGWPPEYGPGKLPHYQVRRYDLPAGRLDQQPVVDKNETGPMIGNRFVSVATRDGTWLYSLYTRDTEGPFVHVLNLNDRYAVCVDLPFPANRDDFDSDMLWSLALAPDEGALYAVNPALGQAAAINTQNLEIRSATLPRLKAEAPGLLAQLARWLVPVAEAKRLIVGGAVVSPDGQTLYALDGSGVAAVATRDLSLQGRFLGDWPLNSLALNARGDTLYAVSNEKAALVRLALPAGRSSRIQLDALTHPWAVLRVSEAR